MPNLNFSRIKDFHLLCIISNPSGRILSLGLELLPYYIHVDEEGIRICEGRHFRLVGLKEKEIGDGVAAIATPEIENE